MKTQLTVIATAVALAASFSAHARDYTDATMGPDATNANNTANPVFDNLETQRASMNGFNGPAGQRTSIIDQQDNGNYAEASQGGVEQYSRIVQSGDLNEAYVEQDGEQHESIINQVSTGAGNLAEVTQLGGYLNDSYIYQEGENNEASVVQINNTEYSDSMIEQLGDSNKADVTQEDNADETWSMISQNGSFNEAYVEQYQADMSASYIYQKGADGHLADVYQTGQDHVSTIRQNGTMGYANHSQAGSGNIAVTTQW